jgi:hypothetical protein
MIRVEAGSSCLEQARLVEHVSAWFGGRLVAPSFDVLVRGDAARPQAVRIELHNGLRSYQREFAATPEACDDRHAVIGLAIALAVDSELAASLSGLHAPARAPRRRVLDVELGTSHGVLHGFGVGAQVSGLLGLTGWCDLRADVFTQLWLRNTIDGSTGSFDAMLFATSLQLQAGGAVAARARLGLASGLAVGALHARGHGYAPNRNATVLWLGLRVGLRMELRVRHAWALDLTAVAPLIVPTFEVSAGTGKVSDQTRPLGLLLHAGPTLRF